MYAMEPMPILRFLCGCIDLSKTRISEYPNIYLDPTNENRMGILSLYLSSFWLQLALTPFEGQLCCSDRSDISRDTGTVQKPRGFFSLIVLER